MQVAALAGNPNCGKTTLFNRLTGSNQYVGNWAGVTVEKKQGLMNCLQGKVILTDLPGIYSLAPYTMEEIAARDFMIKEKPDVIINIVDGTNLERNLYLTTQLMELRRPMVIAVNMMDELESKGDRLDCTLLAKRLGVPVIPITARSGKNFGALLTAVEKQMKSPTLPARPEYSGLDQLAMNEAETLVLSSPALKDPTFSKFYAARLVEGDLAAVKELRLSQAAQRRLEQIVRRWEEASRYGDRETLLADARYRYIEKAVSGAVFHKKNPGELTVSDRIDKIVTSRIFALPLFVLAMGIMFSTTFGQFGTSLKSGVERLIYEGVSPWVLRFLTKVSAPVWCQGLMIDGVIGGVGAVLSFLPQIAILFLFLSVMEDSGYMARAAFIMDRLLRRLGLTGRSFIPMLMGFGCTTPAVMAARTLSSEKDRRMTIMLTPFMSCGARLPIYGLFAGIFFPKHQGFVILSMYLIGILVAVLCGLLLKKKVFSEQEEPFVMELPAYRFPTLRNLALHLWEKCKGFLIKAGTVIFSMSVIIWLLQNFDFRLQLVASGNYSIFGAIGKAIAPFLKPLGFGDWQAAVALLAGLVAKEAVVSTLGVLYGAATNSSVLSAGIMQNFTPLSAYSFMVFCLLYTPCISAFVSIKKEMNSLGWAVKTALLQTTAAYTVSCLIFQWGSIILRWMEAVG